MRLDKLLAHMNYGSRKEVKELIRKGYVLVNGEVVFNDDIKVNEETDDIVVADERVSYQQRTAWPIEEKRKYKYLYVEPIMWDTKL